MNTKDLAGYASAAYVNCTHQNTETDAQAYVEHLDKYSVVAFRGSESLTDWITNLKAYPRKNVRLMGHVHRGFYESLMSIEYAIREGMRREVYITGHSLGGAMATLFAAHLWLNSMHIVKGLVTFGEPRPGSEKLAAIIRRIPGYRYVAHGDPVDNVPFSLPFVKNKYQHGRIATMIGSRTGPDHPMSHYRLNIPEVEL